MSSEDLIEVRPRFVQTTRGAQFRITFCARQAPPSRGRVLFVHPFAEEMNKSRRMVALGARRLAAEGFEITLFDLHGCGDSAGELRDATWDDWVDEVRAVLAELSDGARGATWLWGLRAGALLATAAIADGRVVPDLLLWQPVQAGAQHLQQFLRLNSAAAMIRSDAEARRLDSRGVLAGRESIEVAGYEIGAAFARGMDAARLELPSEYSGRVVWLEVSTTEPANVAPATMRRLSAWRAAGASVVIAACYGLPFWQTQEIAECPALLDATVKGMLAARGDV